MKTFKTIVTFIMILSVVLMFVKIIDHNISSTIVLIPVIMSTIGLFYLLIVENEKNIPAIIMWTFMTIMWSAYSIMENKAKINDKQNIETRYVEDPNKLNKE